MKLSSHRMLAILTVSALLISSQSQAKDYQLYYLGGQSNMDGFGYNKELQGEDAEPVKGVMMFHGNQGLDGHPVDGRGLWAELRPGNGTGFSSDGKENKYSDRFGVELSFARRLKELQPDANIAIINTLAAEPAFLPTQVLVKVWLLGT